MSNNRGCFANGPDAHDLRRVSRGCRGVNYERGVFQKPQSTPQPRPGTPLAEKQVQRKINRDDAVSFRIFVYFFNNLEQNRSSE